VEVEMAALKLTARGQVTFRKDVLKHFGVKPGDRIDLDLLPGGIGRIRATKKKGRIEDVFGMLAGKTDVKLSIEEMNDAIGDAVVAEFERGVRR
jgi:bifunctional DNA-binding transcriptional regulator/antitoxin component of YhaV-PrlF toxin-antitoxin module